MRGPLLTRRDVSAGLLGLLCASCTKKTDKREPSPIPSALLTIPTARPEPPNDRVVQADWTEHTTRVLEWDLSGERVAVLLPKHAPLAPDAGLRRYPVLIALHGRGEALKKPSEGALGWAKDYELLRALERIHAPPLSDADFRGFSDPARLRRMNESLAKTPYDDLIVVCPYLPDLDLRQEGGMHRYGEYLVNVVLPAVRERTPASMSPKETGIDGVSLGGAVGLFVGTAFAEAFGSVGGVQPAIQSADADLWLKRVQDARNKNPEQKLRLLTSTKDYFREGIGKLSARLRARGVAHESLDVPGPHDYIFNKGPGAYELLFFHERSLRGL